MRVNFSNRIEDCTIWVYQFHSSSSLGVIKLVETNKKAQVYIWPIVKIERATAS